MYKNFSELAASAKERDVGLWRIVLDNEMRNTLVSEEKIIERVASSLAVMRQSAAFRENPESDKPTLVGNIALNQRGFSAGENSLCGREINEMMADALACIESDYYMEKICAMPTAGSCGIVPAVLIHAAKKSKADEEGMVRALITASGVGALVAEMATISGAAGGCQAECGTAAMMAAVAAAELCGADGDTALNAGAFAMINAMGLVCDPVAGLIQVPCVYRNASQAVNALLSVDLAMAGNKSLIPLDEVVEAMYEVGQKMPSELRETAKGGLAGTNTAKKLCQDSNSPV